MLLRGERESGQQPRRPCRSTVPAPPQRRYQRSIKEGRLPSASLSGQAFGSEGPLSKIPTIRHPKLLGSTIQSWWNTPAFFVSKANTETMVEAQVPVCLRLAVVGISWQYNVMWTTLASSGRNAYVTFGHFYKRALFLFCFTLAEACDQKAIGNLSFF